MKHIASCSFGKDTRTDSAVCGVVRSPVEVLDVDAFMVNCQTAFDEWFSNLEEQFSGDVAGNLQNQINAIRNDLDNGVYSTTAVLHLHTVPEDGGGGRDVMPGENPCFHVAVSAPLS